MGSAAGGDGTATKVARVLAGRAVRLAVLPARSARVAWQGSLMHSDDELVRDEDGVAATCTVRPAAFTVLAPQ